MDRVGEAGETQSWQFSENAGFKCEVLNGGFGGVSIKDMSPRIVPRGFAQEAPPLAEK